VVDTIAAIVMGRAMALLARVGALEMSDMRMDGGGGDRHGMEEAYDDYFGNFDPRVPTGMSMIMGF
jgi:hypothetical protein